MFALANSQASSGCSLSRATLDHQKQSAAGWQLVGECNRERFLRELGINRTGQRIVVILFFLDARCLQAKVMQLVPGRFVGVTPDNGKDRRAQVGRDDEAAFTYF